VWNRRAGRWPAGADRIDGINYRLEEETVAEGKTFLLGRRNVAAAVTTLVKEGAGPALRLVAGSGAPLAVDSDARVANLNADKLDGRHLDDFSPILVSVRSDGTVANSRGAAVSVSKPRTGVYLLTFDRQVADCYRIAALGNVLSLFVHPDFFGEDPGEGGEVFTSNLQGGATRLGVATRDSAGNPADRPFHLAIFRPGVFSE
jgi:hypothetical protein